MALLKHNSHLKVTYTYPKVTYSGPKEVDHSDPRVNMDPSHLSLPIPTSPDP